MPRNQSRPRLGRGLSSLIRDSSQAPPAGEYLAEAPPVPQPPPDAPAPLATGQLVQAIPLADIEPNPYQPRRSFDATALRELAQSLRTHGLLQPVLIAPAPPGGGDRPYQLLAGERRLRAAELAGLTEIPCIVRPAGRQQTLELALVENLHRTDLNPIERARGYRDLIDRFGLSQQEVAERLAQPRATIANHLRLLHLCDAVRDFLIAGQLSLGHGKVLAGLAGHAELQEQLARRCVREHLSVRQLEDVLRRAAGGDGAGAANEGQAPKTPSPYFADVERQLGAAVGTRVCIRPGRARHSGRIVIEYHSLDDFDRIVAALGANLES